MKTQLIALNHVALHVHNVSESIHFYEEILGFAPIARPAFDFDGAWFSLGGNNELHLIEGRKEPVIGHSRGTHFALQVKSVEAIKQLLETKGIDYKGPKRRPDGPWQIFFSDPDGHVIECTELH